ncbi:unnamed protein product [Prunus armeniaca]
MQMVKGNNAQVIEDPSMTRNLGRQSVQAGEVVVTSVIVAGNLSFLLVMRGMIMRLWQKLVLRQLLLPERTKERKSPRLRTVLSSLIPMAKRLRKRAISEFEGKEEEPAVVPTETTKTDEKEVLNGEKEKTKDGEEEEEIPAEIIAESIELAKKQQEAQIAEPTSSELALFLRFLSFWVEEGRIAGTLAAVTSPLKPSIVAMPIHSIPSSPATASFADPELAEFEAMDLDAQLDKLEQLSPIPGKAKSKVVDEVVGRVKIWQSTELDLAENMEAIDQLMKDPDLLHRQNVAPRPILGISLGLARDVLNLHSRYEDLKPSFKASEFCKATHEANLADYQKQKAELDTMVADYKETKTAADKLGN